MTPPYHLNPPVLPPLPVKISVNAALILQRVHAWLKSPESLRLGERLWVLRSPEQWQQHIPFLSERCLCHTIEELVALGVLMSFPARHRKQGHYFTLNYTRLNQLKAFETSTQGDTGKARP